MKLSPALALSLFLSAAATLPAQIVTHTAVDASTGGVAISPLWVPLASGGTVGASMIAYGVDYSFGSVEGIFNDPPASFGGVNGSGAVDLLTGVDGQIVVLNSLAQGFTDYVSVIAGHSSAGTLRLSVFDEAQQLIASIENAGDLEPMTIDLDGTFNIAYFSVTTPLNDSFGVLSVSINTPVSAMVPVPEPSTYALLGALVLGASVWMRCRSRR